MYADIIEKRPKGRGKEEIRRCKLSAPKPVEKSEIGSRNVLKNCTARVKVWCNKHEPAKSSKRNMRSDKTKEDNQKEKDERTEQKTTLLKYKKAMIKERRARKTAESRALHATALAIFFLALYLQASMAYEAYDCEEGKIEKVDLISNYSRNFPEMAREIKTHGVTKIWDGTKASGEFVVLKYPDVYKMTCKAVQIEHVKTNKCFHRHTTEGRDEGGKTVFVNDEYFIVKKPARITCPVGNAENQIRAQVIEHLDESQTISAINQARMDKPLEDHSYLLENRRALKELAEALDNPVIPDGGDFVETFAYYYKTYITEALMFYSAAFTVYTFILMVVAWCMKIDWLNSLRFICPSVRRGFDLYHFKKEQKKLKELENNKRLRMEAGLNSLPQDVWTNRHLLRIYESIEEIHQRLDAAGIPEIKIGKPKPEEDDESASASTPPSSKSSSEPSPSMIRFQPADQRRREGERRVVYYRNA